MNVSLCDLAGLLNERQIWRLIEDLSSALSQDKTLAEYLMPENICWNGNSFIILPNKKIAFTYLPHEYSANFDSVGANSDNDKAKIWSLGAVTFFAYMGCPVFNGLGGQKQQAESPLPILRKSLPVLSKLISTCLEYLPERRPTLESVSEQARENLKRLSNTKRNLRTQSLNNQTTVATDCDNFWPEHMAD